MNGGEVNDTKAKYKWTNTDTNTILQCYH